MSGKFNVSGGDGEICDADGRIMKILTITYALKIVKDGVLADISPAEKSRLRDSDVIVVVWTFSICGTGKWKGKEQKKSRASKKNKPTHLGAERTIVFLWAGAVANELELGEMAILLAEMKIGQVWQ